MPPTESAANASRNPGSGYFIVIEGIDGTGKSTLSAALAEALRHRGVDCVRSREPTDGPYGRRIREIALSGRHDVSLDEELRLFVDDRRGHVACLILPELNAGRVVILDRYYYSTMAYQGARGADPAAILALHRTFAPEPDLLVILELDVAAALERVRHSRGSVPDAFEGETYLRDVEAGFRRIQHPHLLRLDAREPTDRLVQRIIERLPERFRGH